VHKDAMTCNLKQTDYKLSQIMYCTVSFRTLLFIRLT